VQATARLMARGTWQPEPGRLMAVSAVYTNAFQATATGAAGYRYFGITVSGSWAF
jgi:hypothetical protein